MKTLQPALAFLLCFTVPALTLDAAKVKPTQAAYPVIYSGGSLPTVQPGQLMNLFIDQDQVRLVMTGKKANPEPFIIKTATITEVSYGQEVHRRIGTAVGLAVISLGIGLLVALSKSKKHYIGLVWDAGAGQKGGLVVQADKNQYRGLIAALEGITGKKAVDTDSTKPGS